MTSRRLTIVGLPSALVGLLSVLALAASSALASNHGRFGAAASTHALTARVDHRFLGIVPSARARGRLHGRPTAAEFAGTGLASGGNLLYWGGPVMATSTTYAIYWLGSGGGSVSSGYENIINTFFSNLAAAQNTTNDAYAVATQYYGPTGAHIANQSSAGGWAVDTTNPIPDHCSSEYAGTGVDVSGGCVTDADIQAEATRMIQANGWTPTPNALFFVFTPTNVGSCFDATSGECAYTYYCAYHSDYIASGGEVLYASMPYSLNSGAAGACDSGEYPNGDQAADDAVNLISHEHNESITDPLGTAWYDSSGNEIGDKCAWDFGSGPWPSTGTSSSSEYNQTIGTGHYYLQGEWSNVTAGCKLNYGDSPSNSLSVPGFSPSKARVGRTVTVTGTGFASGDSVYFHGVASPMVKVISATQLTATVPKTASSGRVRVTSSGGSSATSLTSFLVIPSIKTFSPSSGWMGSAVTLNGSGFVGATRVTFGGTSARFRVVSANRIRATVPRKAKSGRIAVTTSGGTARSWTSFRIS